MRGHALMYQYIEIENHTGTPDGNGQPQYGTAIGTRAQVAEKIKVIKGPEGTDVVSSAQVALPPGITVQAQDRITLPSGTAMQVLAVEAARGPFGQVWHRVAYI